MIDDMDLLLMFSYNPVLPRNYNQVKVFDFIKNMPSGILIEDLFACFTTPFLNQQDILKEYSSGTISSWKEVNELLFRIDPFLHAFVVDIWIKIVDYTDEVYQLLPPNLIRDKTTKFET